MFYLPRQTLDFNKACETCYCNKIHKLPFPFPSLKSSISLELIYADVWGPSKMVSSDGYNYYVLFIDHFTRYIWWYPITNKYEISQNFPKFKLLVDKKNSKFNCLNVLGYGGEYNVLRTIFSEHGTQHL